MIEYERKQEIRNIAASFLLRQSVLYPVIDVRDMELPDYVLLSDFDSYAVAVGVDPRVLHLSGKLLDGYTVRFGAYSLILYDAAYETACPQRLRFSLAHEIGHILLGHIKDDDTCEQEANYFSSQIVAPDCVVLPILTGYRSHDIDVIRTKFGVSWDTAAIKVDWINRNSKAYTRAECELCKWYYAEAQYKSYKRNVFRQSVELLLQEM